jgi:hypothetical protein
MKRILQLLLLLFTTLSFSQVGVNTTTPNASSMLDVSATNKGVLFPRVSLSNINLTTLDGTNTAATGLLIWNTNATTTGGNGVGYYYFNSTIWIPLSQTSANDADWYEVGGTTPANAITDDIYTRGDVSIGKISSAFAKLDIDANLKLNTLFLENSNTTAGTKNGIFNSVIMNNNNSTSSGLYNNITGLASFKYGVYSNFSTNNGGGLIYEIGNQNSFYSTGNTSLIGSNNTFAPSGVNNAGIVGYQNTLYSNHSGNFSGFINTITNSTNNDQIGLYNTFTGGGSGIRFGVRNNFGGNASGDIYGNLTEIYSTGTGNKYGESITIDNTNPGIHFGLLSNVTKANSYAGYFLGRVSIGTTLLNNYIFPSSRGTNGQIMQADGTGNINWTDFPSDSDWYEVGGTNPPNSILDNIYTGGDISIGKNTAATAKVDIENNSKSITLDLLNNNLSALSKTGINNTVITNNSMIGAFGIFNNLSGLANIKFGNVNNFNTNTNGPSIEEIGNHNYFTSSGNVLMTGYQNAFFPSTTVNNTIIGYKNVSNGSLNAPFYGFYNQIEIDNSSNINHGLYNSFTGTVSGIGKGVKNIFSNTSNSNTFGIDTEIHTIGTGDKYGERIIIDNVLGGTHYGIYSDVTKFNSYAGYFLGRMSIGTTTANNYVLPLYRGTANQIIQTDGAGNASWVNPVVNTDNQTIDVFSLTGNTLNLSLLNDGMATQTLDLSPLSSGWKLSGNGGTTSGTNFIGTTDTQDLDFRTNNVLKLKLTQQGQLAFQNSGGSVFVGSFAGDNDDLTNNQNTFIGNTSGRFTTTGDLNTAVGFNSLNVNIGGSGNTVVGSNAMNINTSGNNNTVLGRLSNVATASQTNSTAIGFNASVNASDKIRIGNTTVTVIEGQVAYTFPSDARFKFNVKENVPGLDFIKKLKPITYNFDTKKFDEYLNQNRKPENIEADYSKSTAIIHSGFLAQDVEKICADLGYNFDGLHIPDTLNPTDNYSVAYSQFIMPIVKAVQEQQEIIESQKTELEQLKSELEKYKMLEERIKALEQKQSR